MEVRQADTRSGRSKHHRSSAPSTVGSAPCRCRPTTAGPTGLAALSIPRPTAVRPFAHGHVHQRHRAGEPGTVRHGLCFGPGPRGGSGYRAPAGARGASVRGLPLVKPPYDRITAYDMNTGDLIWQKPHSSTPDDIRNHRHSRASTFRLGQPGRTFIARSPPGPC